MARTTSRAVMKILLNDYDGVSSLEPFIESATVITTRVATCATAKGVSLTTAELELIERWLAAHMYTISDPRYTSKRTEKSAGSFALTSYLEGAYAIDTSGCLKGLMENKRLQAFWLGKVPSEQTPYYQRD